jgi:hypothetical protein
MGAWMMLQRNLLYTGVTRAKKLVVRAGSRRALAVAVRTKGAGRRHTALAHRLRAPEEMTIIIATSRTCCMTLVLPSADAPVRQRDHQGKSTDMKHETPSGNLH